MINPQRRFSCAALMPGYSFILDTLRRLSRRTVTKKYPSE
jgi:hypothetical protein